MSRSDRPATVRDRAAVLDLLRAELSAASGSGRAVFLLGRPGADVHAVAGQFIALARRDRRLQVASGDAADATTPAWRQIAVRLTRAQRAGAALRRSLSEWAGIIPVIGPLIGAAISTADDLRGTATDTGPSFGTGSAIDDVRWIAAHGRDKRRLILLEKLEAADAAELSGAFALIQQLKGMKTLLLLTATMDPRHPVAAVIDLLREAERVGVGRRIDAPAPPTGALLSPQETELLAGAAKLGPRFGAPDLARILKRDAAGLEHELEGLARARLIRFTDTIEIDGELVDLYEITSSNPSA